MGVFIALAVLTIGAQANPHLFKRIQGEWKEKIQGLLNGNQKTCH